MELLSDLTKFDDELARLQAKRNEKDTEVCGLDLLDRPSLLYFGHTTNPNHRVL